MNKSIPYNNSVKRYMKIIVPDYLIGIDLRTNEGFESADKLIKREKESKKRKINTWSTNRNI